MHSTTQRDLDILLGAALLPLKAVVDHQTSSIRQALSSFPEDAAPLGDELRFLIRSAEEALYASSVVLADAFLRAVRDRRFRTLADIPQEDRDWFEERALSRLDQQISLLMDGMPRVLRQRYAKLRLGIAWSGSERQCRQNFDFVPSLRTVEDYFRAELRAKAVSAQTDEPDRILDAFELKPAFFGIGLNFNYIFNWIRRKWRHKS